MTTNYASLFGQISHDARQNTSSEVSHATIQFQNKMKKELPNQLKFIEDMTGVVTEEMWCIWNAAFKVMQRYVAELEERAIVSQAQNQTSSTHKMKLLISNYLDG